MDKAVREDALRLLLERRAEIYQRVAALLMDIEGGLALNDWERARYHLEDLRRTLRTSLAFLTDEVYEELEGIEACCGMTAGAPAQPPRAPEELQDRLQLLHVKLSRSLKVPDFQDLEDIVGMELRLKRKLAASREGLQEKIKRREQTEKAWEYEAQARAYIKDKLHRKALKALQQAIRLDPTRAVFQNDLGYVYGQLDRPEEAMTAYREAVRLNEAHPEQRSEEWTTTWFNLGIAVRRASNRAFKAGDDARARSLAEEAIGAFDSYLQATPTGPKVSYTRSVIVQLTEVIQLLDERLAPPAADAEVA